MTEPTEKPTAQTESAKADSVQRVVSRLHSTAQDLRIMEHLIPYGDLCDEAAKEILRLHNALESQIEEAVCSAQEYKRGYMDAMNRVRLLCGLPANAEVSEGGTRDSQTETAAQSRPSLH